MRGSWVARGRGTRLMVGTGPARDTASPRDLDELINETIQRARESGYSLQSPRERCANGSSTLNVSDIWPHLCIRPDLRRIASRDTDSSGLHSFIGLRVINSAAGALLTSARR